MKTSTVIWIETITLVCLSTAIPLRASGDIPSTNQWLRFREPHSTQYQLLNSGDNAGQPWIQVRPGSRSTNVIELGHRMVLQLEPGCSLPSLLSNRNLTVSRTINSNLFILQAGDSLKAVCAAENLAQQPGVRASYPVMRRAFRRHNAYALAPNDSHFSELWHLENRDAEGRSIGPDLNIRAAWPLTRAEDVLVAIVDCGFQLDHAELEQRALGAPHYNFFKDTYSGDPYTSSADHATAVAGLVAAEGDNNLGVAGVAPKAKLSSWVIWGRSRFGEETIASDEQLMDMFQYASNQVAVQNHSWGSADTALLPLDLLSDAGIAHAVERGRNGKGVVIIRAGGNYREAQANVNDDGYANDPRVIAVAAARKDGRACSFSSPGTCLLVAALSGDTIDTDMDGTADAVDPTAPNVLTTDRTGNNGYTQGSDDRADYTGFGGTSASAPQISGIAALILGANPNVGYRDVQQILLQSARHWDLADPGLRTNGAGFVFSHNLGYGIPDAGFAVELARIWPNRPSMSRITAEQTVSITIPDDALRVVCSAPELNSALLSIRCLPSSGPHADTATAALPLVFLGEANEELTRDLYGKAALIARGTSTFTDKIARAARAGAAFAIIFNNVGTTDIQAMGKTFYAPIPAVSIGKTDGETLRDFIAVHPETTAQLSLTPAVLRFPINKTLICEHIGLRLTTSHSSRGDVRVTLVSPSGARSIMQTINQDTSNGLDDWTFWSTQHFYESSAGEWRLEVSDERNTSIRSPFGNTAATGRITFAQLIIQGVSITDSDRDGLDDAWEKLYFENLSQTPQEDTDHDGFSNAREQILQTDPTVPNTTLGLDLALWKVGFWRLSWPAHAGAAYTVLGGRNIFHTTDILAEMAGQFPVGEWIVSLTNGYSFFRVRQEETQ